MARNYDKTYLNGLIDKAKKSWEGVDVDNYMKNLRDDTFDKEVAENLSNEVSTYIINQVKANMDKATIRCRDLMLGDWITNRNGFPMQITNVGEDYAYATFEGLEGDPWEYDDKDCQPSPIEITHEMLGANGWIVYDSRVLINLGSSISIKDEGNIHLEFKEGELSVWLDYENSDGEYADILVPCKYVHQLQHALRLCGLDELADNFKI